MSVEDFCREWFFTDAISAATQLTLNRTLAQIVANYIFRPHIANDLFQLFHLFDHEWNSRSRNFNSATGPMLYPEHDDSEWHVQENYPDWYRFLDGVNIGDLFLVDNDADTKLSQGWKAPKLFHRGHAHWYDQAPSDSDDEDSVAADKKAHPYRQRYIIGRWGSMYFDPLMDAVVVQGIDRIRVRLQIETHLGDETFLTDDHLKEKRTFRPHRRARRRIGMSVRVGDQFAADPQQPKSPFLNEIVNIEQQIDEANERDDQDFDVGGFIVRRLEYLRTKHYEWLSKHDTRRFRAIGDMEISQTVQLPKNESAARQLHETRLTIRQVISIVENMCKSLELDAGARMRGMPTVSEDKSELRIVMVLNDT